jgi:CRP/FNR family transcriptional regulator, dissimilatory nitrate respiration regulator
MNSFPGFYLVIAVSPFLSQKLANTLREVMLFRNLLPGQVLYRQGDRARSVFVLESGQVRIVRRSSESKAILLRLVTPGESFGTTALFSEVYGNEAMAEVPARIHVYPKQALWETLRQRPDVAASFVGSLARQINTLEDRLELRSISSARERIIRYLSSHAQFGKRVVNFDKPLKDIASDLGLSREVLYRTLAQLEREGVITRTRRQIILSSISSIVR